MITFRLFRIFGLLGFWERKQRNIYNQKFINRLRLMNWDLCEKNQGCCNGEIRVCKWRWINVITYLRFFCIIRILTQERNELLNRIFCKTYKSSVERFVEKMKPVILEKKVFEYRALELNEFSQKIHIKNQSRKQKQHHPITTELINLAVEKSVNFNL